MVRKLAFIAAAALALLPGAALAQSGCSGQFPADMVCGRLSTQGLPGPITISGSIITGAALTKADDTNVTLTLGGTPATSLLRATSITAGWTGQLAVSRGGTGASTLTNHGVLLGQGSSAVAVTGAGTAGQVLTSGGPSADPSFVTLSPASLGTQAANTALANVTGGVAVPTAAALPSCSGAYSALTYTSGTGFTCRTSNVPALDAGNSFLGGTSSFAGSGPSAVPLVVNASDDDATESPIFRIDRLSASPLANDVLGAAQFTGRDSNGFVQEYGAIIASITDPTAGVETGGFGLYSMRSGTRTLQLTVGDGINIPNGLAVTRSNSGTSNIAATGSTMTRTTTVGTGGIFMGANIAVTDNGTTASLANQVVRAVLNSNNSASSTASVFVSAPFITESLTTLIGMELASPAVSSTKTLTNYTALSIAAPSGAGTTTNRTAISIAASGGAIVQNDTTSSTSTSTGALRVAGGAAITENLHVGQIIRSFPNTAIPAGGTTGTGIWLSSTNNFGIFFGSGAPTLSAAQGSLYLRSDGAINARLYINTNGSTGWTAFNTAS